jgi:hypothetical protein
VRRAPKLERACMQTVVIRVVQATETEEHTHGAEMAVRQGAPPP